jgi:1-acyl-sn-glycerol-3-phosphate acyltransferase
MLVARHTNWFDRLFGLYFSRWLVPKHLHQITVEGQIDPPHNRPVLYIANHSSWWDGLLIYFLRQTSARKHYVMMDEAQLRSRKLLCKLGAFSIDKSSPKRAIEALHYSAEQLRNGHAVWIFPQGDIHHLESRPLAFESGFAHVLHLHPDTQVVPITFYFSAAISPKISVNITIGDALIKDWQALSRKQISEQLCAALTTQLDAQRLKEIAKLDNHRGN